MQLLACCSKAACRLCNWYEAVMLHLRMIMYLPPHAYLPSQGNLEN
jgi:hypothetical protein